MPELPEVETVRAGLQPFVCNQVITEIRIYWSSIIKQPDLVSFRKFIVGQKILDLKRKAKYLIFELEDFVLISHLRMEGKYYYQNLNDDIEWKHVLLVLKLSNGYELRYHDTRKFGTFHLQKKDEYEQSAPLIKLGPEPFETRATVDYLKKKFKNKNRAIKTMLLDQSIISGLGNIYVDEVLFASKINPVTSCNKLQSEHLKAILNNAKQILTQAIILKGTTIASYTSNVGIKGAYQKLLKVHTRKSLACYVCSSIIEKIKLNGRGTYFCCQCQNKL